jgi:hypothetical protein
MPIQTLSIVIHTCDNVKENLNHAYAYAYAYAYASCMENLCIWELLIKENTIYDFGVTVCYFVMM